MFKKSPPKIFRSDPFSPHLYFGDSGKNLLLTDSRFRYNLTVAKQRITLIPAF